MTAAAAQKIENGDQPALFADTAVTVGDNRYYAPDGKIICLLDGVAVNLIQSHLSRNHAGFTIEAYLKRFGPNVPLMSEQAKAVYAQKLNAAASETTAQVIKHSRETTEKMNFHEVFELGSVPAALSAKGDPIKITVVADRTDDIGTPYMAVVDKDYVFNIDLAKKVIVAFELNMPAYFWGYHGTGKTTMFEQCAARTNRPFMRVQHTINTEESHIVGQYVVRNQEVMEEELHTDGNKVEVRRHRPSTEFQLGPLPLAMLNGMVYCADEYDAAMPSVTLVYQSVLEGKPLVIKDAPPEYRVIRPHPDFRFCATGNTNGVGDETGLYQGTNIQNAANYSRFPIVEEVAYMDAQIEESILRQKTMVPKEIAAKIVKFAGNVREGFKQGSIGMTISPRELLNATKLGIAFGGKFDIGLRLSFANRCSRIDKQVVEGYLERVFGAAK